MSKYLPCIDAGHVHKLIENIAETREVLIENRSKVGADTDQIVNRWGFLACLEAYHLTLLRYEEDVIRDIVLDPRGPAASYYRAGQLIDAGRDLCGVLFTLDA